MLGVERKLEKKHAPIVSYEKTESRPSRKRESRDSVYVEPARTHRDDERRSRHRSERYETVEVTPSSKYETGEPIRLPERSKRGSLYESDMRRPRREYRIEERMPERREKSQDREWREESKEERRERRRRDREYRDSGR